MKKVLLASAVIAAGAAGYIYYDQTEQQASGSLISNIPADSPFVTLQTEAYDQYEYLNAYGYSQTDLMALMETGQDLTPMQTFLVSFLDGYLKSATSAESIKQYLGTPEKISPVFYTLGMVPVYKVQLEDPAAFWKTVDAKEQESGVTHTLKKLDNIEYRSYELATKDLDGLDANLIVAVNDNVLTLTIELPILDAESPLKLALGLEAPKASLVDSGKIEALQSKYGDNYNAFMYIDNAEIIKGVTTTDGNRLARQVGVIDQKEPEPALSVLRSPICQSELATIASNWPREVLVVDYNTANDELQMKGSFVLESGNKVILDALKSIQGFVPAANAKGESMFSAALGVDVTTLAPAVATIWKDLKQPQYSCALLNEMQQNMGADNPAAMLSMAAGMLNGLKGISVEMFDVMPADKPEYGQQFDRLDGMLSFSATNPNMLLQSLTMFVPQLAQLSIQPDGKPVDVTPLIEPQTGIGAKFYAQLNGNHFALYTGDKGKSAADKLMAEPLSSNGIMKFSMDFNRLLEVMEKAAELQGEELTPEMVETLASQPSGTISLDVKDHGIMMNFDYVANMKARKLAKEQQAAN